MRKILELEETGKTICTTQINAYVNDMFDEPIASIALANGAAIVSGNAHFRHIPGRRAISP